MTPSNQRGSILILVVLSTTVLIGMLALTIDAAFMYQRRSQLQAGADAAATSGALEVHRRASICGEQMTLNRFATQALTDNGLTPGGSLTFVETCPAAGYSSAYVEATVQETQSTFFAGVLGITSMRPGAHAVAGTSPSRGCLVVLGTVFDAISMGNNSSLDAINCIVADGGGLDMKPNADISSEDVSIRTGSCGSVANCTTGVPPPTDPLLGLAAPSPAPSHTCTTPPTYAVDTTISVGTADQYYCGMTINGAVITFSPGVYYINGPIAPKNPGSKVTINGSGVMLYFDAGGSIGLDSNFVSMNLSAPTSGPYSGILFYQARGNTSDAVMAKNNGTVTLSGALYFPDANLTMKNNNGMSIDCSLVVAKSVSLTNNTSFRLDNTCAAYGGSPLLTVSLVE